MATLYSPISNPRSNMILAAAELAGFQVNMNHIDMKSTKEPEFLKKNPLGKVPVLETPEGCIFESHAILRHIARSTGKLYGDNNQQSSLVDQWLDFVNCEFLPTITALVLPVLGHVPNDKEKSKVARTEAQKLLKLLDDHLKLNNFMVGNGVTIADIAVAMVAVYGFRLAFDEKYRQSLKNLERWMNAVGTLPQWTKYLGRLNFTKRQYDIPNLKFEDANQKKEQKSQKKEEKPKQEKKEEKKAEEQPAKKEGNPLDALPPSSFNLFDFKTLYVNAADKKEACAELWKQFDPKGFSIYHVKYIKAKGEGKILFLTSNLKNGFLQRVEHFRKYAFAVHGVYGEEPELEIRGVWLWRGDGIPDMIKELDQYEYHTWERLDSGNAAHRELLEQYWCGIEKDDEVVVDGLRARDTGYFK